MLLYKYNKLNKNKKQKIRRNQQIRAREVLVLDSEGQNLGKMSSREALKLAESKALDLVEISPNAKIPVTKIVDFGKWKYEQNKLKKEWNKKDKEKGKLKTETKNIQVKPGTGQDMLDIRARMIREWLDEGHKVKIDLFLYGRYKGMEEGFLKERLTRFIDLIEGEYQVLEDMRKSPKGFSIVIQPKR